jgi:hypothetical protein
VFALLSIATIICRWGKGEPKVQGEHKVRPYMRRHASLIFETETNDPFGFSKFEKSSLFDPRLFILFAGFRCADKKYFGGNYGDARKTYGNSAESGKQREERGFQNPEFFLQETAGAEKGNHILCGKQHSGGTPGPHYDFHGSSEKSRPA